MKKVVFALLAFTFIVSLCFAQGVGVTPLDQKITPETKIFVGEIVSETLIIDSIEGSKEEITVMDAKGNKMKFVLLPPIVIYDEDIAPTVNTAEKGDKVFVLYNVIADGRNDAELIHTIP